MGENGTNSVDMMTEAQRWAITELMRQLDEKYAPGPNVELLTRQGADKLIQQLENVIHYEITFALHVLTDGKVELLQENMTGKEARLRNNRQKGIGDPFMWKEKK